MKNTNIILKCKCFYYLDIQTNKSSYADLSSPSRKSTRQASKRELTGIPQTGKNEGRNSTLNDTATGTHCSAVGTAKVCNWREQRLKGSAYSTTDMAGEASISLRLPLRLGGFTT